MEGEGDEEESKRSKTTNPSLPEELITEILVRLPVKYLLQYKCVSKYWLALISSPEFVKTHLSFSAKDYTRHTFLLKKHSNWCALKQCSVSSLFDESVTESFDLDYPMKPKLISRIVGSVNGLICLCFGVKRNGLVLWNPSLKMFKQIPGPVMNAKTTSAMYGFGYDEVHDDYKIVGIFYNLKSVYVNNNLPAINKIYIEAKIYSLRRGSWKSLDDFTGRGDIVELADYMASAPKNKSLVS